MPHVVYVGEYDEVEVPEAGVVVKHGDPVEVDADLAKRLLEQPSNWAKPNTKAAKAADEES